MKGYIYADHALTIGSAISFHSGGFWHHGKVTNSERSAIPLFERGQKGYVPAQLWVISIELLDCVGATNEFVHCGGEIKERILIQSGTVITCEAHKPCKVCGVYNHTSPMYGDVCEYHRRFADER